MPLFNIYFLKFFPASNVWARFLELRLIVAVEKKLELLGVRQQCEKKDCGHAYAHTGSAGPNPRTGSARKCGVKMLRLALEAV